MKLTPRQQQVAELAAADPTLSAKDIASRLEPRCDFRTVEAHVDAIAAKIKASGFQYPRGGLHLIRRWMKDQAA